MLGRVLLQPWLDECAHTTSSAGEHRQTVSVAGLNHERERLVQLHGHEVGPGCAQHTAHTARAPLHARAAHKHVKVQAVHEADPVDVCALCVRLVCTINR